MKFLLNKNNKLVNKTIKTKVFELEFDTDINTTLNNSSILVDSFVIPILKIQDSNYLINDFNSTNIKEDFEAIITESDLISLGGSGSSEPVDPRPYKVYTALLSQSGTDTPVATVLENTLGGDIVWSYNGVGDYYGTLINAFIENKTILPNTYSASVDGVLEGTFNFIRIDVDTISINTRQNIDGGLVDDLLNVSGNFLFEIRVYN